MERLKNFENKPFDIQDTLNTSVSNVICSLLFGKRFDYEDSKFKHFIVSLNKLFLTINSSSPVFIFPILRFLPIFNVDSIRNIYRDIDAFTMEKIKEHRLNFNESNINDFIDAFLLEQSKRDVQDSTYTGMYSETLQCNKLTWVARVQSCRPFDACKMGLKTYPNFEMISKINVIQ